MVFQEGHLLFTLGYLLAMMPYSSLQRKGCSLHFFLDKKSRVRIRSLYFKVTKETQEKSTLHYKH